MKQSPENSRIPAERRLVGILREVNALGRPENGAAHPEKNRTDVKRWNRWRNVRDDVKTNERVRGENEKRNVSQIRHRSEKHRRARSEPRDQGRSDEIRRHEKRVEDRLTETSVSNRVFRSSRTHLT